MEGCGGGLPSPAAKGLRPLSPGKGWWSLPGAQPLTETQGQGGVREPVGAGAVVTLVARSVATRRAAGQSLFLDLISRLSGLVLGAQGLFLEVSGTLWGAGDCTAVGHAP